MWTPPILLALVAAHLLLIATGRGVPLAQYATRPTVTIVALAFASVFAGLCFYPISATFLLVPAAHLLVTGNGARARRLAVAATVVLGCAFVAYFLFHKFIVLPHLRNVPYLGEYAFVFTPDLITGVAHRLRDYLNIGAYFWLGLDIAWFPELIGLIAIVGLACGLVRLVRRSLGTAQVINALMACCLFVVAAAPLLIVHQYTTTFRVMFTMTAIELLVFFWLLKLLPVGSLLLASACAALGVAMSFVSVYGVASSVNAEYVLDANAVASLPAKRFHSILLLRPGLVRKAFGLDLRNDFGSLPPIDHIFDLLIGPRYDNQADFDVETLRLTRSGPLVLEKNATIIDSSAIYGVPKVADFSQFETVSAQPRGAAGPLNAVDDERFSFWEACGNKPFPMELQLDLPSKRTFSGYELTTVEGPERMPNTWEIWVTTDRENWRRIQTMTEGKPWKLDEVRQYQLPPVPEVLGVKLSILRTDSPGCMRLYEFQPFLK
jgi:hypothetical protein